MRHGFTLIELMIVIAIIAIIAAIAIPNLMESRVTANEAAASASLKSGVFPAEVQFQSGSYQDLDADNVGEYGTLRALSGIIATNKVAANSLKLLQGPLANSTAYSGGSLAIPTATLSTSFAYGTASGYLFTSFVPGETNTSDTTIILNVEGDLCQTALATATNVANNGEKYWVAVTMPEKFGDTGRRPFLICQDGQIRSPAKAFGTAAFYNATGAMPTNGLPIGTTSPATVASKLAGVSRGVAYAYTTAVTGTYAAGTAAAAEAVSVTFMDTAAPVWELFAK